MSDRQYTEFTHRGAWFYPALQLNGTTATSDTPIAATKTPVPFPCKIVAAERTSTIAGTVASATWANIVVQKSVQGTGSFTTIGTMSILGTEANGSVGAATFGTNVNFNAGDVVCITALAATVALQHTANICIAYQELPN